MLLLRTIDWEHVLIVVIVAFIENCGNLFSVQDWVKKEYKSFTVESYIEIERIDWIFRCRIWLYHHAVKLKEFVLHNVIVKSKFDDKSGDKV